MPSAIATAIVGSAVIGGVASNMAAGNAASAEESAANQANATEQGFFNTANNNLQPFIQTGTSAAKQIAGLEGLNDGNSSTIMNTLQGLPGYQFANYQGLKSTQNAATARGLGTSGAALKGAANYSTGLANGYYNNLLSGLQNTENTGAGAAASLTGAATSLGTQIGQNTIGAGQAAAGASIAGGNALTSVANSVPSSLITSSLLQQMQNQNQTSYLTPANNNLIAQASPYDAGNGVGSGLSGDFSA